VAFVTTKGFAHVLEFMSHRGPAEQDLNWERIAPLVPNELCFEVDERTLADGTIAVPLQSDVDALAEAIRQTDVEAVAVCLLNSFVNSDHERRLSAELQQRLPDLPICISSGVDPEMKEYERASTTVINTVLIPLVSEYLDRLQSRLNTYSTTLRIMQSNGGTMSSTVARKRPMTMIESGPAAGALAAAEISSRLGIEHYQYDPVGKLTGHLDPAGKLHRFLYDPAAARFVPDTARGAALTDAALRALRWLSPLTFTAVPPHSGRRIALDRDLDGVLNGDD